MTYRAAGGCGRKISWGNGTENGLPGLCGPFVLLSLSCLYRRDLWRKKRNRRRKKHKKKAETGFPAKVCWLTGETDDKIVSAGQILKGKRTRGPENVLSRMRSSGGVPVRNHLTGQPAFNGLKAGNDCDQIASLPSLSLRQK